MNGTNLSSWIPDETFISPDADTTAIFLAANDISYYEPIYDPMFFANGASNFTLPDGTIFYRPNAFFNVMVCLIQHQICNPSTGECAKLDGEVNFQSGAYALGLNPAQRATVDRFHASFPWSEIHETIDDLGASGKHLMFVIIITDSSFPTAA